MLRLIWEPRALASRSVILRRLLLVVRSGRLADAGPASCPRLKVAACAFSEPRSLGQADPSGTRRRARPRTERRRVRGPEQAERGSRNGYSLGVGDVRCPSRAECDQVWASSFGWAYTNVREDHTVLSPIVGAGAQGVGSADVPAWPDERGGALATISSSVRGTEASAVKARTRTRTRAALVTSRPVRPSLRPAEWRRGHWSTYRASHARSGEPLRRSTAKSAAALSTSSQLTQPG
jgi:hypothetical protein